MYSKLSIGSTIALPRGKGDMPCIGFGTWDSEAKICYNSCIEALKCGYRQIDTGDCYGNEESVGMAMRDSGIPRSQIYLSTKILTAGKDVESTYAKILASVDRINPDQGYVDLFMIHSPNANTPEERKRMWQALELALEQGRVRAIGVSNFSQAHIEELKSIAKTWPPAVNQIEIHPWAQQPRITSYCLSTSPPILLQAYCPIARNLHSQDEVLKAIANDHRKTPNQVLIRWSMQRGYVPLPKSDTPVRIRENLDVFDFELSTEDMSKLGGLDMGSKGACVQVVEGEL